MGQQARMAGADPVDESMAGLNPDLFRLMADISPVGLVVHTEGRAVWVNREAMRLLGAETPEQLIGRTVIEFVHPDERERIAARVKDVYEGKGPAPFIEERFLRLDGSTIRVEVAGVSLDVEGKPAVCVVFRDIDQRKRIEEALRQSEEKHRRLVETARDLIYTMDLEGRLTYIGPQVTRFGYEPEQMVGRSVMDFVHPEDHERVGNEVQRFIASGVPEDPLEFRLIDAEGKPHWVEEGSGILCDREGNPNGLIGTLRDLSDTKLAEMKLRQSEQRFREMAELLPEIVYEMGLNGKLTYINRRALDVSGYTQEDFESGFEAVDILVPEDRERARGNVFKILTGRSETAHEYTVLRKDGSTFPALARSAPIIRDGRPVGVRGIIFNISERKRLEDERQRAEKLSAVGVLAGGIAHDFNNILTSVLGNLSLAEVASGDEATLERQLGGATRACLRARDLTQQLLTFAKGGAPVRQAQTIADLVKETATFALRGSNSLCVFAADEDLWPAEIDAGQISQVVNNLAINAKQAMPEGGTFRIELENVVVKDGHGLPLPEGRYVRMALSDKGTGIPKDVLVRVFDPYFTTKEQGSGLGLAVTHSIVQNHDGCIGVTSQEGEGTTFTIHLPATDKPVHEEPKRKSGIARLGHRILLMDDDAQIRDVAERMLAVLGCEVASAADGETAVALYRGARDEGRPFDLAIMDLTVPGKMGAKEALDRIREVDPEARVIVSSGYSQDPVMSRYLECGFVARIRKPYDLPDLKKAIEEASKAGSDP